MDAGTSASAETLKLNTKHIPVACADQEALGGASWSRRWIFSQVRGGLQVVSRETRKWGPPTESDPRATTARERIPRLSEKPHPRPLTSAPAARGRGWGTHATGEISNVTSKPPAACEAKKASAT